MHAALILYNLFPTTVLAAAHTGMKCKWNDESGGCQSKDSRQTSNCSAKIDDSSIEKQCCEDHHCLMFSTPMQV